ncbi:MAG: LytTR family DNA-binding domain-containing protein [Chitinophagaceae bacterium]
MSLKCIVIDKELSAIELMGNFIQRFPGLKLLEVFDNVIAGSEYIRDNSIDLLFIELSMPANTAIKLVRSISEKIVVIFTVACKQLTPEVLDLDILDYLVKPITFDRFAKAITKITDRYHNITREKETGGTIYIRSTYQLVKINLNEIEYIESVENYSKIHLSGDKPVMTLMPLKIIIDKLPHGKFVRIHRSYIIPLDKIKYIGNRKIKLSVAELPVSESYLPALKELVNK